MMNLDDDKQTNQPTSLPLDEEQDARNFEVNEELATYILQIQLGLVEKDKIFNQNFGS